MKLAEFLLENDNEYNGHKQIDLGEISFKKLREVVAALQEEDPYHLFAICLYCDNSGTVEQNGYWLKGGHPLGHEDRMIFGFQLKEDE